jgi:type I restriction-modification system DNA methylase subunit
MAFFQNSVINKYIQNLDKQTLQNAYAKFRAHFHNATIQDNIRGSKEEQYQGEFLIDLFVNVLGYTKNPTPNFNLTTEYKNVKDSKKADGAIIINDIVKAVIELKGTNTTDLNKIEVQAFGYKNNQPECEYVITSNFEKIRFYIDNAIEYTEFNLFTLTEKEFELLYICLSYDSIAKGLPKQIKDESVSQESLITKKLYNDYSQFKNQLYHSLVKLNPQYEPLELFKKSQKLLDRFLFIFFAEDRQLLPTNLIFRINKEWQQLRNMRIEVSLYDRYKIYFNDLDCGATVSLPAFSQTASKQVEEFQIYAYNGGLFKKDDLLNDIKIEDELLFTHTEKLSNYDFASEVDVNVLGHIFENSLNDVDEIKAQLEGQEIDKTKTKRKKDGVFYTPKYITKYIVDNTVGKLCLEKKEALLITESDYTIDKKRQKKTTQALTDKLNEYRNWLLQLTICDPACGSGAFLNQALDFLITEHRYIDELQAKLFGDALVLSDVEGSILENNLFGVDINEESVEIAKLSLWLRTAQPNRKLNDLNSNIKCGNSLIDDVAVAGDKAFNWQLQFSNIFEKGGFDVIVGNPPYVDIKALPKELVTSLFKNYSTAENRINLYSIFIEKSVTLLKNGGFLSFINPNSMLINTSYQKLRSLIIDGLTEIVKLPDDVFPDAKVETIILFYQKQILAKEVNLILHDRNEVISFIDNSRIKKHNKKEWDTNNGVVFSIYSNKIQQNILDKIDSGCVKMDTIAEFTLGITPYDKYRGHSKEIIENREFHSKTKINEFYKPLITGENITRYYTLEHVNEYIKYGDWLGAMRNEKFFNEPRILVRQIVSGNPLRIFASYTDKQFYFTQIGFGIIPKKEIDVKYLLCLINSNLLNYYHKFRFLDIEKDLFQKILIANCKQLPIKNISIGLQQDFVKKAEIILLLYKELQDLSKKFQSSIERKFNLGSLPKKLEEWYLLSYSDFIKELAKKKIKLSLSDEAEWEEYFNTESKKALEIKLKIDTTDKEIDQMVYKLYDLTDEEIKIVEG